MVRARGLHGHRHVCVSFCHLFGRHDPLPIIASFGASAVLVYGAVKSPLAQPGNLIGGHLISALISVATYQFLGGAWFSIALAVSCALAVMLATGTLHPPGRATALLAVTGGWKKHALGYLYVLGAVGPGLESDFVHPELLAR